MRADSQLGQLVSRMDKPEEPGPIALAETVPASAQMGHVATKSGKVLRVYPVSRGSWVRESHWSNLLL